MNHEGIMKKLSKKSFIILLAILAAIILITVVVVLFIIFRGKNEIVVPPNAIGNSAGNLQNGGLFCEYDGYLYFSNSYDGGALYRMKYEDGSFERLNKNRTYSINAVGNNLYYCMLSERSTISGLGSLTRNAGIYSCRLDGEKTVNLNTNAGIAMQYYGNYLYYQESTDTGTTLVKQSVESKEKTTLSPQVIDPSSVVNGTLYYSNAADGHFLYAADLETGVSNRLWDTPVWNPVYDNGYIYYLTMDGKYNLCRRAINDTNVEVLTNDFVDTFNVYKSIIYYCVSAGDNPAIKRMNIDGSNPEIVRTGIYHDVNVTSDYVYYSQYNNIVPIYRQSTFGPIYEDEFSEAVTAALKNISEEN